jgi:serine/threonine-protein kinase HipA
MNLTEKRHGVWLGDYRVGTLNQRGDYTWFVFTEEYGNDPARPVLGLRFEQEVYTRRVGELRLPPWFSNLLPESQPLRRWIAEDRNVSVDREMELLAQVGHDLPGAVIVLPEEGVPEPWRPSASKSARPVGDRPRVKFSLAGVGLKFSMLKQGDRLTLPASGEGGDWIVKLPDPVYRDVPRNEYAMMSMAGAVGIDIPELWLVHRDQVDDDVPTRVWPKREKWAYATRRFDRGDQRQLIHIEDLAQVRDFYPDGGGKYRGSFETVASLLYRQRDLPALREFARRLAFIVLISNGDAHLKNWSLIYRDPHVPTLSPAYDLVSTAAYLDRHSDEDLGLKFGGSRRFERVSLATFERLQRRLGAPKAELPAVVADTVEKVRTKWPEFAPWLNENHELAEAIDESIKQRTGTLLRATV